MGSKKKVVKPAGKAASAKPGPKVVQPVEAPAVPVTSPSVEEAAATAAVDQEAEEKAFHEEIGREIWAELLRAEEKHPEAFRDVLQGGMVVAEEAGEFVRAVNEFNKADEAHTYLGGSGREWDAARARMEIEAIQTAAMCVRFLKIFRGLKKSRVEEF